MPFDTVRYLGATTRAVLNRQHEGKPAHVVVATCHYATDPADLWDALTSTERLPRWLAPVTGDLRLGGRYQVQGNAGGLITGCEPPRLLTLTWEFGGEVSWVHVTLAPEGEGTLLTLEHIAPAGGEHWNRYGPGAVGVGWDLSLLGLRHHLLHPAAHDGGAEGMAWMGSPAGKQFVRDASDGWRQAAIAGGEDPAAATARAERTHAFYSGEPEDGAAPPAA